MPRGTWAYLSLISLLAIAALACQASGEGFSGLWDIRYEVLYSTPGAVPVSSVTSIVENGTEISGSVSVNEPEPMDGTISGSSSSDSFNITMLLYRKNVAVIRLEGGRGDSGLLQGSFVAASSDGDAWRGNFLASLMNPDPYFLGNILTASTVDTTVDTTASEPAFRESTPSDIILPPTPIKDRFFEISYSRDTVYARPVM